MRSNSVAKRLLSVFLVLCMVCAWVLPANAADDGISVTQVSNDRVSAGLVGKDAVELEEEAPQYEPTEIVRVSIFLNQESVIEAGYAMTNLMANDAALAYRAEVKKQQDSVTAQIEKAINTELDVVWNLTLVTNLISAYVEYGQIAAIEKVAGVRLVVIETPYEPDVVSVSEADPNMATSGVQTGTMASYVAGYTGAGSRIAIIDTGLDTEHLSFDAAAYEYSLSLLAEKAGKSVEEYVAGLNLLDAEEIAGVLSQLNAFKKMPSVTAEDLYVNSKIGFGFNYVDSNVNLGHMQDGQGEHGSHVSGIATANAYVPNGDGTFSNALEKVYVQGVAPDAQILVMKVFGAKGGAYAADYMAAIEDAIVLDVDSINMSLGSGNPGMSSAGEYEAIYKRLENSGVVLSNSAGNSFAWMEASENGVPYLYLDDVSMQTNGSPGSYTNSLSVASVDNAGFISTYAPVVFVNGKTVSYYDSNDYGSNYGNAPFSNLGGEYEFVFLNGIGTPEQFAALGEDALEGKIAMCYRGETSFFEKCNAAVEAGAIAVIVVNNVDETFGMNLTGYSYKAPAVSISLSAGEKFKLNPITNEAGTVMGWTGTLEVPEEAYPALYDDAYYTMSSFSSWGVPGSLELKPEVTAPGGSILSVNGANAAYANYAHDQYEVMSGTSMAAPQVAGMAAVIAQYIRENNLEEATGLDARTLAQSLLMSTAVPVLEGANGGYYYSILKQGAGLANVGAAVMADSYIIMGADATNSWADGKVKVELGDDPARAGVYTFSFTINNLTDEDEIFALYADFFTQNAFATSSALYLDTWTRPLQPMVTYTVDGEPLAAKNLPATYDFNGDGTVNAVDGQMILDYAAGAIAEITANADLNEDGAVTTDDAYLFFVELGKNGTTVAANGSVEVEVTVTLSSRDRAWLANYENGAYLEGFVYAESVGNVEGVMGTTHSIPVLGYYGNWSDPSMFDKGSYEEYYLSKTENRAPYLYQSVFAKGNMNTLLITYGNEPGKYYHFGGNPIVADAVYMPERNAISGVNGDVISKLGFTSIRNAAASFYQVVDLTNQKVLANQALGEVSSAYYHVNQGAWKQTYLTLTTNLSMKTLADNTLVSVGLCLVPEYYVNAEGQVDFSALGEGTTFGMTMTVDNTAPVLEDVSLSLMNNTLTIEARDNQYIAAVALLNGNGTKVLALTGAQADAEPNELCEYELDMAGAKGNSFLVQVYDYAMNCTTYELNLAGGETVDTVESVQLSQTSLVLQKGKTAQLIATVQPDNVSNAKVVWSSTNEAVATVDENGNVLATGAGKAQIVATSELDKSFSAACNVEVIDIAVDMNAVIWDEEGAIWFSEFNTADLPKYVKVSGNMLSTDYFCTACMSPSGTLYASSLNTQTGTGALYTINTETWEATKLTDCVVQDIPIFYSDLAYAPNLYGTGVDGLLATYGPFVIALDATTGEALEIIDEYDSELVGIAVCYGLYDEENAQSMVATYVAQANGVVTQEVYCHLPDYGMTLPFYYYMYGERMTLKTNINVGDAWYFNSLHYNADRGMIFWAAFDQKSDTAVTLYAIDEMNDFAVFELGQFPEDVWPVGGLYEDVTAATANAAAAEKFVVDTENLVNRNIQIKKLETMEIASAETTEAEEKEYVSFNVTSEYDSTNGVVTASWNTDELTLVNVLVNADYYSVEQSEGSVTVAYVALDAIEAGEAIVTLVFEAVDPENVNVSVAFVESGLGYCLHKKQVLVGDVKATCTEPGYTGDVYCDTCGELLSVGEVIPAGHQYTGSVTVAPALDATGSIVLTCQACDEAYTVTLPALNENDYSCEVVLAPTATADGLNCYTWNETAYGTFSFYATVAHEVAERAAQMVINSVEAKAGNVVVVEVLLKNNPGIQGIIGRLVYDESVMTLLSVENGTVLADMDQERNLLWSADAETTEDGVLCTITFQMAENAPAGAYPVAFILEDAVNEAEENVQLHVVFGSVTVSYIPYGDVNGDGKITLADALRLRKFLANRDPETGASDVIVEAGADVNGDGAVDLLDALRLRKFLASRDPITGESSVVLGPQ